MDTDNCTPVHFGPYPLGGAYEYMYFEPGSWWVYRNSLTGERDSVVVTSCDTQVVSHTGYTLRYQSVTYTAIRMRTRSDRYNTDYEYMSYAKYPDNTPYKFIHDRWRSASFNPGIAGPWQIFRYPFPEQDIPDFFQYIPKMNILGQEYTEVGVFSLRNDRTVQLPMPKGNYTGSAFTKYYWANGYGIVKIEAVIYNHVIKQNQLMFWELEKSHLVN